MGENVTNTKIETREISIKNLFFSVIFWILTLGCCVLIFMLSAESGLESSQLSGAFLDFLNESFNTNLTDDSLIRELAHASEFAILTVFTYFALSSTNKISIKSSYAESPVKLMRSDNEMSIIFTLWFTTLNAIFDEYHQLFVNDRDGNIKDVLIDAIGIIIVLVIIRVVFTVYLKTKGKTEVVYT